MRRFFRVVLFLTLLLASCQLQPDSTPVGVSSPLETPSPAHAPEIRFALIGESRTSRVNIWQLFDREAPGVTYASHAMFSGYFPRLYHLAPQDSSFQPYAAEGFPSEVTQEGDKYSALVKLRPDLKWTDGSSFTAEDAVFTVETALAFELDNDWDEYYPREVLDHAEAIDRSTLKIVFKHKPNVGIWQYGVLQGPIVQEAFWKSAVQSASALLPDSALRAKIAETRASLEVAQSDFEILNAQVIALRVSGKQNRKLDSDYTRMQGEVFYIQNTLNKLLEDYAAQIKSAQEALYAATVEKEPTLGAWMPDAEKDGVWINKVNPDHPFGVPNFDHSTYRFFENENAALAAFQNGEVDFILSPNSIEGGHADTKYNPSYSARFLIFNPLNGYLANPAFRSALACMIDRKVLATDILQNKAASLDSFVLSSQWHDTNLKNACASMDKTARVAYAVKLLKDAGDTWAQEPDAQTAGQDLIMSNGEAFPKITLLAPTKEDDALRYAAAKYIAEQAQYLGIPFAVQEASLNDAVYAVYSSQKYDMVLMGWRLSEYPAYLCEWFGGENPFLYNSSRLKTVCDALEVESNLDAARRAVTQIESALMSELPFIPLFRVMRADVYHELSYPAPAVNILNGWGGLYGAPSYAIPMP
jgi:ABC-type transport system substrate-binding protein